MYLSDPFEVGYGRNLIHRNNVFGIVVTDGHEMTHKYIAINLKGIYRNLLLIYMPDC